jgi:PAS domain S-box-containing protein
MDGELRILVVDNTSADVELMLEEIGKLGRPVKADRVETEEGFTRAVDVFDPHVILSEYRLPSLSGRDALAITRRIRPETPFIFVARDARTGQAIKVLEEGATDYIPKHQLDRLGPSVQRALREAEILEERDWAEVQLFRSEERFRNVIENASDLFVIVDAQAMLTYISPSVKRVLGYETDEVTGDYLFDYFHPEEREGAMGILWGILATPGTTPALSFRVLHKSGAWRFLEGNANNLLDNRIVSGIVITARDVTDRVLQARRLQKLNQCFLSLGAQSYENTRTVVEASREILQSTIVQYCKQGREGMMAISTKPGEEEFAPVPDYPSLPCYQVMRDNAEEPLCIEDLRRTGFAAIYPDIIHFGLKSFLAYPVRLGGKTIGCLSLFEKRRRVYSEEEMATLATLAQTIAIEEERLQREERLREFLDIASHEMRHPIALVSGYARFLMEDGESLEAEERKRILDVVFRGAERLDHLAGELLDVSHIESGEFSVEKSKVELEPLMRQAVREMQERGYKQRFRVNVAPEAAAAEADQVQLMRVMMILLDNACNYSPGTSQVLVKVGVDAAGDAVLVSVLDRGIGVTDEHRERIYDRFYQCEDTLHHSKSGIGLGLYIARDVVVRHGGRIWSEPRPGGGSIFRFTLPRVATGRRKSKTDRIKLQPIK